MEKLLACPRCNKFDKIDIESQCTQTDATIGGVAMGAAGELAGLGEVGKMAVSAAGREIASEINRGLKFRCQRCGIDYTRKNHKQKEHEYRHQRRWLCARPWVLAFAMLWGAGKIIGWLS